MVGMQDNHPVCRPTVASHVSLPLIGLPRAAFLLWLAVALWAAAPASAAPGGRAPNIVLILADDMGFSDLGCYGSEIRTPNVDRLAHGGLRFSQFYNVGRCCPTRAALMTGLYPHQTGVGHMMDDTMRPGYRGNLNTQCVTLAEVLHAAGYQTMMCGKWHLTRHVAPAGPKFNWPLQRGFDLFYGTIMGAGSYFDPLSLTRGNEQFRATGDYYYTDAITDRAADFIEKAGHSPKPFFLYVAYTAPHWPLHAPAELAARHRGQYRIGWDDLREARRRRQIAQGLIRESWPLTPRDARVPAWELTPDRPWQERRMEVYAAQIDEMDQGVGKILERIRQIGAEENTLVMLLSDNGGCAEELGDLRASPSLASLAPPKTRDGRPLQFGNRSNLMPGPSDTFQSYGIGWANASNTPFRLYKHWVHEGGIATPLVVYWPAVIHDAGGIVHEPGHVIDIMATCAEVAGTKYPAAFGGFPILPLEGESLLAVFEGKTRHRGPMFWEHEGNRAVRDGKWKLVSTFSGQWELYDMEADRTEMHDLSRRFPVIVKDLQGSYEEWANRVHVEPWPVGKMTR